MGSNRSAGFVDGVIAAPELRDYPGKPNAPPTFETPALRPMHSQPALVGGMVRSYTWSFPSKWQRARGMATERLDVRFSGHVQGVGFRYTTLGLARRRPVTGFVQNLPAGSVRLVVEGDSSELDGLLAEVLQAFAGQIRETLSERLPASGEFAGFSIRF